MESLYAQAIDRELARGTSEAKVFENLYASLKASGRMKLLPRIKRELESLQTHRAKLLPRVEAASEKEAHAALASAKAEGIVAEKALINHSLIRGWRARGNGVTIDRSGKRALIDLYQRIVKA
jgi:hypothetical protein